MPIRAQPLLVVADVQRASRWYQQVLGGPSGHGGGGYDQILVEGSMVLQLHARDVAHHHGAIADSDGPVGNGAAIWFETDDFDAVARRSLATGADVVTDVHVNPNAGHRELWLRDPDGYLVVFAEAT